MSGETPEPVKWCEVALMVGSRSAKQCRERWVHHLAPEVSKVPWTAEEDTILFEALKLHKTSWAAIAKLLPGRTDHCVKNRYYSTKRRIERKAKRKESGDNSLFLEEGEGGERSGKKRRKANA